ncbi:MAG: hypothetical protein SGJ20_03025, partial [Planctomycetota bacterium]|nr:hypothetical protein [Planctomycetota bacterium]
LAAANATELTLMQTMFCVQVPLLATLGVLWIYRQAGWRMVDAFAAAEPERLASSAFAGDGETTFDSFHCNQWLVVLPLAALSFNWLALNSVWPSYRLTTLIQIPILFCQGVLLVIWLALGNGPALRRLLIVVALVVLSLLAARYTPGVTFQFGARLLLVLISAAVPIGLLKFAGFRLIRPALAVRENRVPDSRFTLWQLFGWMITIVVLIGLAAYLLQQAHRNITLAGLLTSLLGILLLDAVLIAALLATLAEKALPRVAILAFLLVPILIAGLSAFGAVSIYKYSAFLLAGLSLPATLLIALALWICRRAGWRLVRI